MQRTRAKEGAAAWPRVKVDGCWIDAATNTDPITGLQFCADCWDGMHPREGCQVPACKCGCYHGRITVKSGLNKPKKGFDSELPDVGGFTL